MKGKKKERQEKVPPNIGLGRNRGLRTYDEMDKNPNTSLVLTVLLSHVGGGGDKMSLEGRPGNGILTRQQDPKQVEGSSLSF